jgi:enamine deaminase RidA (YjgF/YER057c/UK114 family)
MRSETAIFSPVTSVVSLLRSTTLAETPYAYAASVPASSRLLFMAGACPLHSDGFTAGAGDHVEQARVCLDNLEQALADAGATITDVVTTRILVVATTRDDLVSVWNVVSGRFGAHDVPSTLIGVSLLGYRDQLVEIEAVAAVVD